MRQPIKKFDIYSIPPESNLVTTRWPRRPLTLGTRLRYTLNAMSACTKGIRPLLAPAPTTFSGFLLRLHYAILWGGESIWGIELTHVGCALIEHIPLYLTLVAGGNSVEILPLNTAWPPGFCTNSALDNPPNCSSVISVHCSRASFFLKSHKTSSYFNRSIGSGKSVLATVFKVGFCKIPFNPFMIPLPVAMLLFVLVPRASHLFWFGRRLVTRGLKDGGCLQSLQGTPPKFNPKKMLREQVYSVKTQVYHARCLHL